MTFLKHNETLGVGNSIAAVDYVFSPYEGTVIVKSFPTVGVFLKIINLTDDIVIYDPQIPGLGGVLKEDENCITLDYDTTSMSTNDKLLIIYTPNGDRQYSTQDVVHLLHEVLVELRINNLYLSMISGDEVTSKDLSIH